MFSTISTYIWGAAEAGSATQEQQHQSVPRTRDESPATPEDWVVVPGIQQPAPGDLAPHHPLPSLTPSSASSASSVAGDPEAEVGGPAAEAAAAAAPLGQENTRVPVRMSHDNTVGVKGMKSAQICKQRSSGKALSSKALKRSNQAVIHGKRKETVKYNLPIKSAGLNKNLKQC